MHAIGITFVQEITRLWDSSLYRNRPYSPNVNGHLLLYRLLVWTQGEDLHLWWTDLIKCEWFGAGEKLKAHVLWLSQLALVKLGISVSERVQDHQECVVLRHHPGKDMKTLNHSRRWTTYGNSAMLLRTNLNKTFINIRPDSASLHLLPVSFSTTF